MSLHGEKGDEVPNSNKIKQPKPKNPQFYILYSFSSNLSPPFLLCSIENDYSYTYSQSRSLLSITIDSLRIMIFPFKSMRTEFGKSMKNPFNTYQLFRRSNSNILSLHVLKKYFKLMLIKSKTLHFILDKRQVVDSGLITNQMST